MQIDAVQGEDCSCKNPTKYKNLACDILCLVVDEYCRRKVECTFDDVIF